VDQSRNESEEGKEEVEQEVQSYKALRSSQLVEEHGIPTKKGSEPTATSLEKDSHDRTEEGEDEQEGGEKLSVLQEKKRVNSTATRKGKKRRTVMQLVLCSCGPSSSSCSSAATFRWM
jgi:hypothetical protein